MCIASSLSSGVHLCIYLCTLFAFGPPVAKRKPCVHTCSAGSPQGQRVSMQEAIFTVMVLRMLGGYSLVFTCCFSSCFDTTDITAAIFVFYPVGVFTLEAAVSSDDLIRFVQFVNMFLVGSLGGGFAT